MIEKPTISKCGQFSDLRGSMRFVNDFRFEDAKRFYFIKHPDISTIRAWRNTNLKKSTSTLYFQEALLWPG